MHLDVPGASILLSPFIPDKEIWQNCWCFFVSLYYWVVNSCFFDNIFSPQRCESAEIYLFFSLLCVLCTRNSVEGAKIKASACLCALGVSAVLFSFLGCGLTAALGLRGICFTEGDETPGYKEREHF